jgi:carbonic anhydrase/acetyltransferase-like protein (isoleucine patch superfamily)
MAIYQLQDDIPQIAKTAWVAEEGVVIGKIHMAAHSSVWPGAVLRGDNEPIVIGENSNIHEGAVLHTDLGCPLTVGKDVTVGHQAVLHGCTIEDRALIGIQAVVLNRAVIGAGSLVGAGAIVTEGKVFPPRSLILGAPAKVVRQLSDEDVARMKNGAAHYVQRQQEFSTHLKRID